MNMLVYRIGQLGDAVISLPAIHALRAAFQGAKMTLLCDRHPGKKYVFAADLFKGSGLFDAVATYPVDRSLSGRLLRPFRMLHLLAWLRAKRFDILAYLAPSNRTGRQIRRDRKFFRAAGISKILGIPTAEWGGQAVEGFVGDEAQHEADFLLSRLAASGIPIPAKGRGRIDLPLTVEDDREVDQWLAQFPSRHTSSWIGFAPGSKMPAKKWPLERFEAVGHELIEKFQVWPVIFGGPEDREPGDRLLRAWKHGFNAAGQLGVRASTAALRRCALYVGNDTGTMHLAAAAGIPCVAVFSARDLAGKWNPYGFGHQVLRVRVDCEGCMLTSCTQHDNECLKQIAVVDVVNACQQLLNQDAESRSVLSQTSNSHGAPRRNTLSLATLCQREEP